MRVFHVAIFNGVVEAKMHLCGRNSIGMRRIGQGEFTSYGAQKRIVWLLAYV